MEEETLFDYRKGASVWTDYNCLSRVGINGGLHRLGQQQCGAGKDKYLFVGGGGNLVSSSQTLITSVVIR